MTNVVFSGQPFFKFNMAASYHGDGDGYLGLYESTHVKLSEFQCSCFLFFKFWALLMISGH